MQPDETIAQPPAGAPWDLEIEATPWVFFDVEMTGLDPARDALIEVSFLRQERGRLVGECTSLVAADVPSAPAAAALHGIAPDALAGSARFAEIAPAIVELLRGAVAVGHGVDLDVIFLNRAFAAAGVEPPDLRFVIDTLTLARRAVASPRYSLSHLIAALGLPPRRWHRAREDALAVQSLLPVLVRELGAVSARDLWEVRVGQREAVRVRQSVAAKLDALHASQRPCTLVVRARGRPATALRGVVERWESPHVRLRSLSPRGGVRVVRADRVLRVEPSG